MSIPPELTHYFWHRPQRIALLQHIAEQGSITRAAQAAGLSYKGAWDAIDELNNLAPRPLVERSVGGRGGGGARLSEDGARVLRLYQRLQALQAQVLAIAEDNADLGLLNRLLLHTSARNQLAGTVGLIERAEGMDLVHLDLGGGVAIKAQITPDSTRRLQLVVGTPVTALMKAGWVQLQGVQSSPASGDNALPARVEALEPVDSGPAEVRLALSNGQTLCALADAHRVHALGLQTGTTVLACFDPGSVLLGRPF
jgi:molybdate transport system regulatory protein